MGVLGDKCVRCGRPATRGGGRTLPICLTCEAELKSEREAKRRCPIDGSELEKEIVSNVVIDQCPVCRGLWLDAGELRLILEGRRMQQWLDGFAHTMEDLV